MKLMRLTIVITASLTMLTAGSASAQMLTKALTYAGRLEVGQVHLPRSMSEIT